MSALRSVLSVIRVVEPSMQPPPGESRIPGGLVAATVIDGAVDGLLIGLAYSASTTAGLTPLW